MATLRDRLAHLSFVKASKLLGPGGSRLITRGGQYAVDPMSDVEVGRDVVRVNVEGATVSLLDDDRSVSKMRFLCSECEGVCEHIGAAFSVILEEKTVLGLAAPPPETDEPVLMSDAELVARELARRADRADSERMSVKSADSTTPWTDYTVVSRETGKSYRVALRGFERGESFCSCPDFRKNTLGTCKHILRVVKNVKPRFSEQELAKPYVPTRLSVFVNYGADIELRLLLPPAQLKDSSLRAFSPFLHKPINDIPRFMRAVAGYLAAGGDLVIYPDAEELINHRLHQERVDNLVKSIRRDPAGHPLRRTLLSVELMPYQLDGIAFVVGAGRAVLADDMGLGKTIQAIGSAELLARECGITKVLVVCPASVKAQWCSEVARFSGRPTLLVSGSNRERAAQYASDAFFTVCNYEQVIRDLPHIESARWDLIILDEGQRIKNWEAKTSRTIKGLRSRYALVLSGTPLENRLDELYSVVEFIDDRRLGAGFRFFHEHRIVDERGKTLGYRNLDKLRARLSPILLRRTRSAILTQLPPRTTQIVRIPPTDEQLTLHGHHMRIVASITRKSYISEMDLLRLQKSLLAARMCADSTLLVDKQAPGFSSKLERLAELLPRLAAEDGRKVILFSEWTTMLDQIESILNEHAIRFVRLDGSVPQKRRQGLVHEFQHDPVCTFFLTTNAGATGLNLQAANTIVNVDLPWNPAILEQRIGRAHRMGQKRPVHVYLMVTEQTIEENMLRTLALKHDLAQAALDLESDITKVDLASGIDELKKRLEVLLGEKPEAQEDTSEKRRVEEETARLARKRSVEEAGGKLIGAAFGLLGSLISRPEPSEATSAVAHQVKVSLEQCMERTEDGALSLRLRLPDHSALEQLSQAIAGLLAASGTPQR